MPDRVFITGGSGFIGTNLVRHFRNANDEVINFDIAVPRDSSQRDSWVQGDIHDSDSLTRALNDFSPTVILHVAARTDLDGTSLEDYSANIQGVRNMAVAARTLPSLARIVFFSSMLVCEFGYVPTHETDYRPSNPYGASKVEGEKLVRELAAGLPWILVRPTSIWGPWFGAPYSGFFRAVQAGWFVLPRSYSALRSYGYIENLIAEVAALIKAPEEQAVGRMFYLADYVPLDLRDWANRISAACGRNRIAEVPVLLLKAMALAGDLLKYFGWKNPPLTRFRLNNLLSSAVFDMSRLAAICPVLPVELDDGVRRTLAWINCEAEAGREQQKSS